MAKRKTRRRFSDEFKSEAVKRVKQSNRSMADLAMELGINAKSIGEWVKRAEESGQAIEEDERVELRRLRKENRRCCIERLNLPLRVWPDVGSRTSDTSGVFSTTDTEHYWPVRDRRRRGSVNPITRLELVSILTY